MMFGYVYMTTNLINGKIYCGRKKSSVFIPSYKGSGVILNKAINKYDFKTELLGCYENSWELDFAEQSYIELFDCQNKDKGYNITDGGDGTNGLPRTSEQKLKLQSFQRSLKGVKYKCLLTNLTMRVKMGVKPHRNINRHTEFKLTGDVRKLMKSVKHVLVKVED